MSVTPNYSRRRTDHAICVDGGGGRRQSLYRGPAFKGRGPRQREVVRGRRPFPPRPVPPALGPRRRGAARRGGPASPGPPCVCASRLAGLRPAPRTAPLADPGGHSRPPDGMVIRPLLAPPSPSRLRQRLRCVSRFHPSTMRILHTHKGRRLSLGINILLLFADNYLLYLLSSENSDVKNSVKILVEHRLSIIFTCLYFI